MTDAPTTDFATALDEMHAAEFELMEHRERVAAMRRAIPAAPPGPDYEFTRLVDGTTDAVRLSELFTSPDRTLVIYHFMYGKQQTAACPMCSAWADGWNGVTGHLDRRLDFVVAAAAPIEEWAALATERGWSHLDLVSTAGSTFKADVGGEDAEGNQWPYISVWTLDDDGRPRQRYGASAIFDDGHGRGLDLLNPIWHFFDLTPDGRGDFMP